jgi:hypothetical protein
MERQMDGLVFMSYAREDVDRVRALVDFFSNQSLSVWWDRDIEPGQRFRNVIGDVLEKSSCAVVVWTRTSVNSDFVRSEADRAQKRGVLVPVLFDGDAEIPLGFTELQHADLSNWDGLAGETIDRLVSRLRWLTQRKTHSSDYAGTLLDNDWAIEQSKSATIELQGLVSGIRSVGEVLSIEGKPAEDIRGALTEVERTYRAVKGAIRRFVAPALGPSPLDPQPYLEMEGGVLSSDIENGRGHCLRILTFYGKAHGLRDWLMSRLKEEHLTELDAIFERLGTADGDLFTQMTEIGRVLTNESRVIVNLLFSGQESVARRRIIEGRQKLVPLDDALNTAQEQLKILESSLGFATPSARM